MIHGRRPPPHLECLDRHNEYSYVMNREVCRCMDKSRGSSGDGGGDGALRQATSVQLQSSWSTLARCRQLLTQLDNMCIVQDLRIYYYGMISNQ